MLLRKVNWFSLIVACAGALTLTTKPTAARAMSVCPTETLSVSSCDYTSIPYYLRAECEACGYDIGCRLDPTYGYLAWCEHAT